MHVIPADVIAQRIADKRKAQARREFAQATATYRDNPADLSAVSRQAARGFAMLRAARRAERGEF